MNTLVAGILSRGVVINAEELEKNSDKLLLRLFKARLENWRKIRENPRSR